MPRKKKSDVVNEDGTTAPAKETKKAKNAAPVEGLTPETIALLAAERETAAGLLNGIAGATIDNEQEFQTVVSWIAGAREKKKALEERRKQITGPLDQAKKSVMDLFRPPVEMLDSYMGACQRLVDGVAAAQNAAQIEAQNAIRAAGGTAAVTSDLVVAATGQAAMQLPAGSYYLESDIWSFTDETGVQALDSAVMTYLQHRGVPGPVLAALQQHLGVPHAYANLRLQIDLDYLAKQVKEHGQAFQVHGITVTHKKQTVAKS